ncbi:MAG: hypothetical protein F6J90_06850 [Moorea sp. SIOASIH]|uniref:hypothetical protein n=1 Tax=Moorena sp. SIOASIH TaxID=2607817 RepID=UPI0013BB6E9F|nr:hypothetical protein [Moorena sp. SIOASIH]NEO36056.1 hypothetical protein [Moorena sp. SIOASIH]
MERIALPIKVRTLIQAAKAVVVNFCLLPLAFCLARRAILSRFILFILSAVIVLLSSALPNSLLASQAASPLAQVRIKTETVVGQQDFFRVGKSHKGRWWLIDPDGKPFLYRGVTSVNFGYPAPYVPVVEDKYGQDPAAFREATFERLRSWNFNALGAWTPPQLWDQGMPYTVILNFVKAAPDSELRVDDKKLKLPDVFDPKWIEGIDAKAKEIVAPVASSKLLVGYFTDNELNWAHAETRDRKVNSELLLTNNAKASLLQFCLSLNKEKPAYSAAWDFVLKRHGNSLEQLAKDWQVPIESRDTIKEWTKTKQGIVSKGYLVDQNAFQAEFARRYFQETAAAIHRYDHNHLILGCRFGAPPSDAVFSAIKRPWVDVVSANNYRYNMYERIDLYYQATKLPVLNSEFSWGHTRFTKRALPDEPEDGFSERSRMMRNGAKSLARALTHPALVGYTWYRWVDLPGHTPPISFGLVNLEDDPNLSHTTLLKRLNARADAIATTAKGIGNRE